VFEPTVDFAETPDIPLSSFAVVAHHFADTSDSPESASAYNFDFDSWCMTSNLALTYLQTDSTSEAGRKVD